MSTITVKYVRTIFAKTMVVFVALVIFVGARDAANAQSALGTAGAYNIFVYNSDTDGTDAGGAVAVGGNLICSNYAISDAGSTANGNALVVGGNVSYTGGTIYGNVVAGGNVGLYNATVTGTVSTPGTVTYTGATPNRVAAQPLPFSFATTEAGLTKSSTVTWSGLPATTVVPYYGGLTLNGSSSTLNVFDLTAAQLNVATSLNINVPSGSTVLVNVSGQTITIPGFQINLNGCSAQTVLYNFYQATTITDSSTRIEGSVLAPLATFTGGYIHVNGTVIVNNLQGFVEVGTDPFLGVLPANPTTVGVVPEPKSLIGVLLGLGAVLLMVIRRKPVSKQTPQPATIG